MTTLWNNNCSPLQPEIERVQHSYLRRKPKFCAMLCPNAFWSNFFIGMQLGWRRTPCQMFATLLLLQTCG
jgi:hypothetical protein